jgi:cytochrome P450
MASFRALALLDAHPHESDRADRELAQSDLSRPDELRFLRACVLESLRLWPTTPTILSETTTETAWESGALPAKTALLIFVPYFHRDPLRLRYADAFAPDSWLDGSTPGDWPLIPFSAGPAECPGRNLVLFVSSALLASLIKHHRLRQIQPRPLHAREPLAAAFSPFRLRFELAIRP